MSIDGHWHATGEAARRAATLSVTRVEQSLSLSVVSTDGQVLLASVGPVSITDRLGNVERRLTFADGSVFATLDNEAMDAAFADRNRPARWVHRLESSMPLIVVAVLGTVLFAAAFLRYGIPFTSERIAHALPQRAGEIISISTLDFLDDWAFEPSAMDETSKHAIETRMRDRLLPLDTRNDDIRYRLHFRDWTMNDRPVPNALALPSGDIVLTDAFVELCESDDEMDSVILHEIGHVVERHSLQRIVEATIIGSIAMLVTGDGSAFADMGVGLGSLLVSSHYSRSHEAAADRYAFDRMLQAGIDPVVFGDIMARLTASMAHDAGKSSRSTGVDDSAETPVKEEASESPQERDVLDFVASHPSSSDRIEQARRYSDCYQRGQTQCEID